MWLKTSTYQINRNQHQNNVDRWRHSLEVLLVLLLLSFWLVACTDSSSDINTQPVAATESAAQPTQPPLDPTYAAQIAAQRDPNIPDLPFPDNPDPSQCGIPTQWGEEGEAWLNGRYQGEMVQETVLLYESHLRLQISTQAPHGTKVDVILYQQNPVTDYYFVKIEGAEQPNEGWVPGPFLSFEPVEPIN